MLCNKRIDLSTAGVQFLYTRKPVYAVKCPIEFTQVILLAVFYLHGSYVFTAAKLIAPVMDKKDWEAGFDWVVETIKLDHEFLASKMEIEKALHYLKTKEFDKVIGHVPRLFYRHSPCCNVVTSLTLSSYLPTDSPGIRRCWNLG